MAEYDERKRALSALDKQLLPDLALHQGIELGGDLIGNQHPGPGIQGPEQRNSCQLSPRELMGPAA